MFCVQQKTVYCCQVCWLLASFYWRGSSFALHIQCLLQALLLGNRCFTLSMKCTSSHFYFCTWSSFVRVLLLSYLMCNLVINVYNSSWWLCLFHVADRWKISIKMYFWLDINKFVMWCNRKQAKLCYCFVFTFVYEYNTQQWMKHNWDIDP